MSYRTPAEVLAVASQVLAVAAPELSPPRPVRRTGVEPRMIAVQGSPPAPARAPPVTDLLAVGGPGGGRGDGRGHPGPGGHPRPRGHCSSALAEALAAADLPVVDARDMRKGGLFEPLVLLAAEAANGLEFDSVVVVEPGIIAGETARGLRTLYVALTRPTQRLSVVYLTPPPAPLDGRALNPRGSRLGAGPLWPGPGLAPTARPGSWITPDTGPRSGPETGPAG